MEKKNTNPIMNIIGYFKSNPIVLLLLIASIIVSFTTDNFFSWGNFGNLVSNTAVRFLIALGVSGCLITKGTDLSAGRQVGFAACLAGILCQRGDYANRVFKFIPEMNIGLVLIIVIIAGAIWGLIPAIFKARWNTNETLFTLMMNYIAIQLTSFLVAKWENPYGSNTVGIINKTTQAGWFPSILGQPYLLNVIIVLAVTVLMFLYLKYAKHGYEIAVVGESENTARYAGISVRKVIVRTMALSGAICGMSGFVAVAGSGHTISTSTAGGRGFTAIIVAWMAKFNTFVMILIALLLVFLEKGAMQIASQFRLNDYASNVVMGIILFFLLGSEFFIQYTVHFRHHKKEADA